ncbi:MAG: radical SAM protein [Candidatus Aureabacteria bacterium]|nr:radical SAM protein [Candidatus Auribacterota bacterium]
MWQKKFKSICPVCDRPLEAFFYEEAGKIYIKKDCPEHGKIIDLASSDKDIFIGKMSLAHEDYSRNCSIERCNVGIFACKDHFARKAPITFIEVTPRCNMQCPICYIDASTRGSDVPLEDIKKMLDEVRKNDPDTHLVLIGGEPTIHKDFFGILDAVRQAGLIKRCYLATNGITMSDENFCRKVYDAGLRWFYLAFDGVDKDICKRIRGSYRSYDAARKTIENLRKFKRARIVLSVTVVKGLNESQLPKVVDFALENTDVVKRISISVEIFCGRQTLIPDVIDKRITPECIEKILTGSLGLQSATMALALVGVAMRPLKIAGLLPEKLWTYTMPHPMCGSIGLIGKKADGRRFSIIDSLVRNPGKNLYRHGLRIEKLAHRMEKAKSRLSKNIFGRILWKMLVFSFFIPVYFIMLAAFIRPLFILDSIKSFFLSVITGKKMKDCLLGRKRMEIHYLVCSDKYNFIWEKMPYCATHHYRIDPKSKKVIKMCGCYVLPFRSYTESCNTMG